MLFRSESAMMREEFEHVIEKADSRPNRVPAMTFNDEHASNVGFLGHAPDGGSSHLAVTSLAPISASVSRSAWSNCAVCCVVPSVMRTQPSQS